MSHDHGSKTATVVHTVKRDAAKAPASGSSAKKVPSQTSRPVDRQLQRKLLTAVNGIEQKPIAVELIISTLREVLSPALVHYIDRDNARSLRAPSHPELSETLPIGATDQLRQWANDTCESGNTGVHELSGAHRWTVVTVPVILRDRPPEVLCAVFKSGTADRGRVASTLQLGASHITLWYILREAKQANVESKNTSALLELLAKLDNSEDLNSACYALVNDLKDYLGCGRIALGLTRSRKVDCRLTAVSGLSDFDKRSEFAEQLESLLNEALLRDKITVVGASADEADPGTLAHQNYRASSGCKTVISAPLHSGEGKIIGAWVFTDEKPVPDMNETLHFVRASQVVVGSRLWMLQRAEVHPLMQPLAAMRKHIGTSKFAVILLAVVLLAASMAIPMNYKIGCEFQLEPISRRFVAAPYDGTLEESLVESGQIVNRGQVLARMDARELRWELSGLQADYQSEKKKRNAAAARDEVASAQQSTLEMERMDLKMQLIRHRLENLDVKSPIAGIVIAGDLKKSEGAPLAIGQTMFEIGPLDEMIVEVAIPEREILHVREGMEVRIRLDAAQHKTETGSVVRISPRSETRDNESVYIAEVKLENRDQVFRPGMKGTAKIISDPHPLGWNLFHKAWESFAMMVGC